MHPVLHVSMLSKYISYPSHVLQPQSVELNEDLTFEEEPVAIVDYQVRQLRSKSFLWLKYCGEATVCKSILGRQKSRYGRCIPNFFLNNFRPFLL